MNSALSASDEKNWAPTMAKKAGFMGAGRMSDCPYITAFGRPISLGSCGRHALL
jgi:hypothetical protein